MQTAYGLQSLKLVKAGVTLWLSHGKAAERVLDRYESLIAALDAIYDRKYEPAVRGVRDELVREKNIVTLCFLADILKSNNVLQTILQGSRLNFLEIKPASCENLLKILRSKAEARNSQDGCYYSKLSYIIDIAKKPTPARFTLRSSNEFNSEDFVLNTIRPFISGLIEEIEIAFEIPDHINSFSATDPFNIPVDAEMLTSYGIDGIRYIATFYGQSKIINDNFELPIVN